MGSPRGVPEVSGRCLAPCLLVAAASCASNASKAPEVTVEVGGADVVIVVEVKVEVVVMVVETVVLILT